jgi:hypothetical protein
MREVLLQSMELHQFLLGEYSCLGSKLDLAAIAKSKEICYTAGVLAALGPFIVSLTG